LTNEQWDFPNAWPPLQIIAFQGLAYTKDPAANSLAYELARNWVYANHKGYLDAKEMFEKVRIKITWLSRGVFLNWWSVGCCQSVVYFFLVPKVYLALYCTHFTISGKITTL